MSVLKSKMFGFIIYILHVQNFVFSHYNYACRTPLDDVGHCISLKYCPEVPLLFTTLPKNQATEYSRILQKICGHRLDMDRYPMVCCTKPNYRPKQNVDYDIVPIIIVEVDDSAESKVDTKTTPLPEVYETTTPNLDFLKNTKKQKSCVGFDNQFGICKPLENCTSLINKLRRDPSNENFKTFLRSSHGICEDTGTEVCCTDALTVSPIPTPKIVPRNGTNLVHTRLPTEAQCGRKTETIFTKVIGGRDSQPGAWPWIALLGYDRQSPNVFRCGGTLVTARHVVSAAHCMLPELSFVRLGEFDLSAKDEANYVDIAIGKVIGHEKYTRSGMLNDLALLCLNRDVDFTAFIHPICLPTSTELREKSFVDYRPFAAGWGRTTESGDPANILQEVSLLVHENDVCRDAFISKLHSSARLTDEHFGKSVLCAGELAGGKDTCKGDSGGPLMAPEPYKGQLHYYLIGVVSYGIGCAKAGLPSIYTSTQYFIDWIIQKIEEN